ncbi:MAG: hypothetical protein HQK50_04850 [Oligoflexia bacterium]|nr:hypothetical protein [Oligoflexia bacterium]MBF0364875.1 hypothetical protein [Oligoflexia bacterium]
MIYKSLPALLCLLFTFFSSAITFAANVDLKTIPPGTYEMIGRYSSGDRTFVVYDGTPQEIRIHLWGKRVFYSFIPGKRYFYKVAIKLKNSVQSGQPGVKGHLLNVQGIHTYDLSVPQYSSVSEELYFGKGGEKVIKKRKRRSRDNNGRNQA